MRVQSTNRYLLPAEIDHAEYAIGYSLPTTIERLGADINKYIYILMESKMQSSHV